MFMFGRKKKTSSGSSASRADEKGAVRFPIRLEFTLSFLVVMLATIILFLIFDGLFLERFYMRDKEQTLRETYEELNTAATTGDISSDVFDNTLKKNAGRNNIGIVVMDAESVTVKAYSTDSRILIKRLYDNMFGLDQTMSSADADRYIEDSQNGASEESGAGESGTSGEAQQSGGGSSDTSGGNASSGTDDGQLDLPVGFVSYILNVIEQTDHYTLQSVLDANTASRYMELWGTLDSGYFFLLRTPLESIQDASAIATRFFLYLSLFATVIGIVLAMYLGRRITKPIRELTDVSVRMKNLDFSAKYTGQNDTEVGELGKNFNEMSDTLERTISELKSANNQLKQDIKKREEADTMRSEFLSNVTHELKTPIALIQGYAEGLEDCVNDDPESRSYYAEVIVDEAGKMNTMVQKLLTLSHIESGQEQINMEHFDICSLISRYLQSASKLAENKKAEVRVDPQPGTKKIMVWSDSFLVEEVFTNYFSNACNHVEAAADGSRIINVRIMKDEKRGKVRISVFNTGKPIPEESLPRIWEKFYKVDKARTRAYGGSGIGLSIVKAIMDRLGEQYGVKNYNNGVEFYMELDAGNSVTPVQEESTDSAAEKKGSADPVTPPEQKGSSDPSAPLKEDRTRSNPSGEAHDSNH